MTSQIEALSAEPYTGLFELTEAELAARGMRRVRADADVGFPCRVSLEDARTGEDLILLNHVHIPEGSPYAAAHAIYVRRDARQAQPALGEIPQVLARRLLSVRAFDADFMMVDAEVAPGCEVARVIEAFLARDGVVEVHLHNAKQGCFAARAVPAT